MLKWFLWGQVWGCGLFYLAQDRNWWQGIYNWGNETSGLKKQCEFLSNLACIICNNLSSYEVQNEVLNTELKSVNKIKAEIYEPYRTNWHGSG